MNTNLAKVEELIQDYKLDLAKVALDEVSVSTRSEKRMKGHFLAKIYFHKGDYAKASEILNETLIQNGKHIGLLSDKACSSYLQNDFTQFEEDLITLVEAFEECKYTISRESRIKTSVCIGKFLEIEARISDALDLYEEAFDICDSKREKLMVLSQILRLKSKWGIKKDIEKNYKYLFMINENLSLSNQVFEVNHALFLAELFLFSEKVALERFERIKKTLSADDINLFIIDYLDGCLNRGLEIKRDLIKVVQKKSLSITEKLTIDIALSKEVTTQGLINIAPFAEVLQIMAYLINTGDLDDHQYLMLIESLTGSNKKYWLELIDNSTKVKSIEFNLEQKEIIYQKNRLNLKRKKLACSLIELFNESSKVSLDRVLEELYGLDYSESNFHRVRMMIKRLNTDFAKGLGVSSVFNLDKESVKLSEGVKLILK